MIMRGGFEPERIQGLAKDDFRGMEEVPGLGHVAVVTEGRHSWLSQ
jgi:hypothetical protein